MRAARRLHRRTVRLEARRFLVEGPQAVREALLHAPVDDVFVTPAAAKRHADLLASVGDPAEVRTVTDAAMAALATTVTPQGIVAVCRFVDAGLETVLADAPRLLAILARVRDPGNAGTVLRTADAAGADAVLVTAGSVDVYNPKCVRSSAGSLFHLPVVTELYPDHALPELRSAGLRVVLADAGAARTVHQAADAGALSRPTAWVFGNEAWGVPAGDALRADEALRVPIHGRAESLNLGVSAAVCLYASSHAQHGG